MQNQVIILEPTALIYERKQQNSQLLQVTSPGESYFSHICNQAWIRSSLVEYPTATRKGDEKGKMEVLSICRFSMDHGSFEGLLAFNLHTRVIQAEFAVRTAKGRQHPRKDAERKHIHTSVTMAASKRTIGSHIARQLKPVTHLE